MKLRTMPCRATQDGLDVVEAFDKGGPLEKGMAKPLQNSCLENPIKSMKRQKYMPQKDEALPSQVSSCPIYYWGKVEK